MESKTKDMLLIAGIGYLAFWYFKMQSKGGNIFSGIAATLFGEQVASGKVGESVGNSYFSQPVGGGLSGVKLETNPGVSIPFNATDDLSNWDARYATGYKSIASTVFGVPTVNVPVTDAAFAKIGLTTAQVEYIQMHYPNFVTQIVVDLKQGNPLNNDEKQILSEVGYVTPIDNPTPAIGQQYPGGSATTLPSQPVNEPTFNMNDYINQIASTPEQVEAMQNTGMYYIGF